MLTQGPYQIPSVSFIFHHSFHFHIIGFPHLCKGNHDHCVVTANNGAQECWEVHLCQCLCQGTWGVYHIFIFCSCFWLSLSLFPLIRCYYCIETAVSFVKIILKVRFLITALSISLKKGKWSHFNHPLGNSPYFINQNQTSRSSLSFQLVDLLSLFIFVPCFNAANSLECKLDLMTLGKTRN